MRWMAARAAILACASSCVAAAGLAMPPFQDVPKPRTAPSDPLSLPVVPSRGSLFDVPLEPAPGSVQSEPTKLPDVPPEGELFDVPEGFGFESFEATFLTPEQESRLPKAEDIRPLPPVPIPDDPPPSEADLFDLPIVVNPPDLLLIEVLEARRGLPITGERLVRPDGTITLGFYGDLHVRGLTTAQIKTLMILKLRETLSDDALGILGIDGEDNPLFIEPERSDRVFVDIAAYNSTVYYVQGYVGHPGRYPWTGIDTVLDALNYAGGLREFADTKSMRLIRPARGEVPEKAYKVDLDAISRGQTKANYQLFPGDRLLVYRRQPELPPAPPEIVEPTEAEGADANPDAPQ